MNRPPESYQQPADRLARSWGSPPHPAHGIQPVLRRAAFGNATRPSVPPPSPRGRAAELAKEKHMARNNPKKIRSKAAKKAAKAAPKKTAAKGVSR